MGTPVSVSKTGSLHWRNCLADSAFGQTAKQKSSLQGASATPLKWGGANLTLVLLCYGELTGEGNYGGTADQIAIQACN